MATVIPINEHEIAEIIFEYSENIPNDFYVHIMNLVKIYYEHGNNLEEIHNYINENKNRINKDLLIKIKKALKPQEEISCNCTISLDYYNCSVFKGLFWVVIGLIVIFAFISVMILNLIKK